MTPIHVIGGGLAGSEVAQQNAKVAESYTGQYLAPYFEKGAAKTKKRA